MAPGVAMGLIKEGKINLAVICDSISMVMRIILGDYDLK